MACSTKATDSKDRAESEGPTTTLLGSFDSDSAYKFVAEQVAFGPRNPNSEGHRACGNYLVEKLK